MDQIIPPAVPAGAPILEKSQPPKQHVLIIIGAGVLLIGAAIAGAYFYLHTKAIDPEQEYLRAIPDEWHGYRNEQFGYELAYPSEYEGPNTGPGSFDFKSEFTDLLHLNYSQERLHSIDITVNEECYLDLCNTPAERVEVIRGISWELVPVDTSTRGTPPLVTAYYRTMHGGRTYVVNFENEPEHRRIMETFRFLDAEQPSEKGVVASAMGPCVLTDGRCAKPLFEDYALVYRDRSFLEPHSFSLVGAARNATTTLVEYVEKEAAAFLQSESNPGQFGIFTKWSYPATGNRLFFRTYPASGKDAYAHGFYSYDVPTRTFAALPVASKRAFSHGVGSPDGFRVLAVDCADRYTPGDPFDCGTLMLIDLWKDTARPILTLRAGEGFVPKYDGVGFGIPEYRVEWLDANTIRYEVYDLTKEAVTDESGNTAYPLKRVGTLKVR